jgi:Zn-dependent M32 family carboxypeptidase
MMKLADEIDNAIVALEELLSEALRELERADDLPDDWADELSDADESGQKALSAIGQASDFSVYVDALQKMLRRIDEHEEQP